MAEDEAPLEPARILELAGIDGDLGRLGPRREAEHDRGGEGPGLRGVVANLADADAGLLTYLARHRILETLARLDEAGQGRVLALGPGTLAAEQSALAIGHQHDDG